MNHHNHSPKSSSWMICAMMVILLTMVVASIPKSSFGQSFPNYIGENYQRVLNNLQIRPDILSYDTISYDDLSAAIYVYYENLRNAVYSFDADRQCLLGIITFPDTTGRMSLVHQLDVSCYRVPPTEYRWVDHSTSIFSIWKVCLTADRNQTLIFMMSAKQETEITDFLKKSLGYVQ